LKVAIRDLVMPTSKDSKNTLAAMLDKRNATHCSQSIQRHYNICRNVRLDCNNYFAIEGIDRYYFYVSLKYQKF